MVFERTGVAGYQGLVRDHPAYCDLAKDRQQCERHFSQTYPTVPRINCRNSALSDALHPVPILTVGGWAWVNNSASTILQGVKTYTDAKLLNA